MNKVLLICMLVLMSRLAIGAEAVQTLRGATGVLELGAAPPPEHQAITRRPAPRNYPQQPPLIPHNVQGLMIQTRVNMCLACHARQTEKRSNAAKLPDSHFLDRAGTPSGDIVAPRRWFCVQCHVPQLDTPPLVSSTYRAPQTATTTK
ncbi:MAG: nitrate reductase cytochrome c-type subunit [Gammaproteobacteria bacterium]|nr:nitrate reductase cytochrome c-type subunit [Gammaproteobacteria bacterium]